MSVYWGRQRFQRKLYKIFIKQKNILTVLGSRCLIWKGLVLISERVNLLVQACFKEYPI